MPHLTAIVILLPIVLLFSCVSSAEVQARFDIAPTGDDNGPGTIEKPFATLDRALRAVREVDRPLRGDVEIVFAGGVYEIPNTVTLGPADGGGDGHAVVWRARPDEKPVLSGGRHITGWARGDGDIWNVKIDDPGIGNITQLFVSGQRRERARLPHTGWYVRAGGDDGKLSGWANQMNQEDNEALAKRSLFFNEGDVNSAWHDLKSVEVVVLQYWTEARLKIEAVDDENNAVLFTSGSWRPLSWSFGYYADNVREGLDKPGAWYYDKETKTLSYHALPGEDPASLDIATPVLDVLFRIEGSEADGQYVTDMAFHGLSFQHTTWELPPDGYVYAQAELPPPAAITAAWTRRLHMEDCSISHMGGWGLELGRGCQDIDVRYTTIEDMGAGCVKVGETEEPGSDEAEACRITLSDCRFADGCEVYLGAPAVWFGQSGHNTIAHNDITGQFMWAISVGWNWAYFPLNRARDNIVEKNHIHHLGTGTMGVHGALYCLGVSPGTVLRNNHIHHIYATEAWDAGEGIILDNGCVGILIENNLVHDADSGGWGCNFNCLGSLIINNIFANGVRYQLTRYGDRPHGTPPPNGELFGRNIVVWKEGKLFKESDWPQFGTLWNQNLYYNGGAEPIQFLRYSFEEWQAKGLDQDSIIADPLFVDPENGDYSLRPESPAFKLGFRPIDVSDAGPRPKS